MKIEGPRAKLLALVIPALCVGVACGLILAAVDALAEGLQHLVWDDLPEALGVAGEPAWWTVLILTAAGLLVGLVVWRFPGGAGPDPATEGLIGPPLKPATVPGLLLATVLTLAGGVSLGPENPITAVNVTLAVALGLRFLPSIKGEMWLGLATAGTIGALFGTPVAAALILSEVFAGKSDTALWDRLFGPLLAAGAGALTTSVMAHAAIEIDLPAYPGFHLVDLVSGTAIAVAACALGLSAVYAFPKVHGLFQRVGHPVLMIGLGGLVLGVLGAIGGRITLFKGLSEMQELLAEQHTNGGLLLIVLVKLAALLTAATCGFKGGRIFPIVFVGVVFGLLAHQLVDAVPIGLAVGSALLGVLLATTRQGWLSLFLAVTVVADIALLPVLCVILAPAWLLATGRPEMQIKSEHREAVAR
ncbi:ion channel protein [Actinocorallia longicatena]|uniref:Ion channel protein n=1 Tax=Actinocorallia longicatena TaxID=111803 RepID=A0ABP6QCU6_9ACTN